MRFILIYELANREFDNMLLLKCELENRGHKVYLCNKNQDVLLFHRKAIVLIPNSSHKSDLDKYRYKFNLKDNPIVIYSCEQLTNHTLPNDFDVSISNPIKKLHIFCWGNDYRKFMISNGFDANLVRITGAIHLDFCRKEFLSFYFNRKKIAQMYSLPLDKKWLLFISDFVFASGENYSTYKCADSIHKEGIEKRHFYEIETQDTIVHWFEKLFTNSNEYIVIYRKHPVEIKTQIIYDMEKRFPNNFYEISDLNIKQWISVSDYISCYYSTAAIEAAASGKECILLRPTEFPPDINMSEYFFFKNYPKIRNYNEFIDALRYTNNNNKEIILDSIKEYYDISVRPSFMRVADQLEIVAKEHNSTLLERHYSINRLIYLYKSQYLTKIFIKKCYRFLYKKFRYVPKRESTISIKEWITFEENRENMKQKIKIINNIIKNIGNL